MKEAIRKEDGAEELKRTVRRKRSVIDRERGERRKKPTELQMQKDVVQK